MGGVSGAKLTDLSGDLLAKLLRRPAQQTANICAALLLSASGNKKLMTLDEKLFENCRLRGILRLGHDDFLKLCLPNTAFLVTPGAFLNANAESFFKKAVLHNCPRMTALLIKNKAYFDDDILTLAMQSAFETGNSDFVYGAVGPILVHSLLAKRWGMVSLIDSFNLLDRAVIQYVRSYLKVDLKWFSELDSVIDQAFQNGQFGTVAALMCWNVRPVFVDIPAEMRLKRFQMRKSIVGQELLEKLLDYGCDEQFKVVLPHHSASVDFPSLLAKAPDHLHTFISKYDTLRTPKSTRVVFSRSGSGTSTILSPRQSGQSVTRLDDSIGSPDSVKTRPMPELQELQIGTSLSSGSGSNPEIETPDSVRQSLARSNELFSIKTESSSPLPIGIPDVQISDHFYNDTPQNLFDANGAHFDFDPESTDIVIDNLNENIALFEFENLSQEKDTINFRESLRTFLNTHLGKIPPRELVRLMIRAGQLHLTEKQFDFASILIVSKLRHWAVSIPISLHFNDWLHTHHFWITIPNACVISLLSAVYANNLVAADLVHKSKCSLHKTDINAELFPSAGKLSQYITDGKQLAFFHSIKLGNLDMIEWCIEKFAIDTSRGIVLDYTAKTGDIEVIKLLLVKYHFPSQLYLRLATTLITSGKVDRFGVLVKAAFALKHAPLLHPLLNIVRSTDHPDALSYFPTQTDNFKLCPVLIAVQNRDTPLLQYLVRNGHILDHYTLEHFAVMEDWNTFCYMLKFAKHSYVTIDTEYSKHCDKLLHSDVLIE